MFIELVHGRVGERPNLRGRWVPTLTSIADAALGWFGATSGLARDGTFLAMLAFDSEESARITMDGLHDRGAWDELASLVMDLTFRECPNVLASNLRDTGDTHLVHVTQGFADEVGRVVPLFERMMDAGGSQRGVSGSLLCWDDAGFTSIALYLDTVEGQDRTVPDRVRREAATVLEQPAHVNLVDLYSILQTATLPPDEPEESRPVLG